MLIPALHGKAQAPGSDNVMCKRSARPITDVWVFVEPEVGQMQELRCIHAMHGAWVCARVFVHAS